MLYKKNILAKIALIVTVSSITGCMATEPMAVDSRKELGTVKISNASSTIDRWKISCSADRNSISYNRKEDMWTFKESKNYCPGGFFKQRAEINTDKFHVNTKNSYLFESDITFKSNSKEPFSIFQLHDGRDGCAPPASILVNENGNLYITSDVKIGPGEQCIRGNLGTVSKDSIKRDGSTHNLRVLFDFKGDGVFILSIWLDGKLQIQDTYTPAKNGWKSTKYYFKHGVYSKNMFDYVMTSKNKKLTKVYYN